MITKTGKEKHLIRVDLQKTIFTKNAKDIVSNSSGFSARHVTESEYLKIKRRYTPKWHYATQDFRGDELEVNILVAAFDDWMSRAEVISLEWKDFKPVKEEFDYRY